MCARTQDYQSSLKDLRKNQNEATVETSQVARASEISDATLLPPNENQDPYVAKWTSSRLLYIDGFTYHKESLKVGRIYWRCVKYSSKGGCSGRASTSNPSEGEEIIVYRGPRESKHNHPPSSAEMTEIEGKENIEPAASERDSVSSRRVDTASASDPRNKIASMSTEMKVASESGLMSIPQSKKRKRTYSFESGDSQDSTSAKLIGKRLCIGNYMYTKHDNGPPAKWVCRNYRNLGCPARAITSDPSKKGERLQVFKGLNVLKHNHPPILAEVEEAEEVAKFRFKRVKRKTSTPQTLTSNSSHVKSLPSTTNYSSNRAKVDKAASTNRSKLKSSTVLATKKKIPVSRKHRDPRKLSLAADSDIYRAFLTSFLRDPVFDRKSVFKALRTIYSSDVGCLVPYATVLENREKVRKDLESLKNDPDAAIFAINCNPTLDERESVEAHTSSSPTERSSNAKTSITEPSMKMYQAQGSRSSGEQKKTDAILQALNSASPESTTSIITSASDGAGLKNEMISVNSCDANLGRNSNPRAAGMLERDQISQNSCQNFLVRETDIPSLRAIDRQDDSHHLRRAEHIHPTLVDAHSSGVLEPSITTIDLSGGDFGGDTDAKQENSMVDLTNDDVDMERDNIQHEHDILQDKENQTSNYLENAVNLQQIFEPCEFLTRQSTEPTLISCIQVPLVYDILRLPDGGIFDQGQFYTEIRVYRRSVGSQFK